MIEKYGERTVLYTELKTYPNGRNNYTNAFTVCKCGKEQWVRLSSLKAGKCLMCKSCDAKIKSFKGSGVAALNKVVREYKYSAKKRCLEYSLTIDDFKELVFGKCSYCLREPTREANGWIDSIVIGGIDRVNNSIGYIKENCVSCCRQCNWMKKDLSREEFLEHIGRIYEAVYGR